MKPLTLITAVLIGFAIGKIQAPANAEVAYVIPAPLMTDLEYADLIEKCG